MSNEDIVKMLECIEILAFCEDANRSFDYCEEDGRECVECQIDFCKQELKQGKTLKF